MMLGFARIAKWLWPDQEDDLSCIEEETPRKAQKPVELSDAIPYLRKPRVYLTMPNFGSMMPEVAHSWYDLEWAANPRKISVPYRREVRMSSIVGSFNNLWADGLNQRDKDAVDYFAMQHNDVEPEAWWLDYCISELQMRNAGLISVVSPIKKHDEWLTTNAWGREDDIWYRRLIPMDEMLSYPVTFAPEQVAEPGEVMLFNTACWVADIRHPVWDEFLFKQYARFVKNDAGERECELMPEDWEMAHFCHTHKIPYLITRGVKLKHFGPEFWTNYVEGDSEGRNEPHRDSARNGVGT
jgi:hypothetical protein